MQRHSLRGFALGMFLTACVILLVSYSHNEDRHQEVTKTFSKDEAIQKLEKDGYHVLSTSEWIDLQKQIENIEDNNKDTVSDSEDQDKDNVVKENEPITYVLEIKQGMNSIDVGEELAVANIIKSKRGFQEYLIETGLDTSIQLGSYMIKSDMSYEEIGTLITGKQ